MTDRILVAGVGNLFLGDDGFGCEAARQLAARPQPQGVRVVDYGIRGMHLAYDLLDGYAALIILDVLPARLDDGGRPGDVTVLEVGPDDVSGAALDAHGMDPVAVLGSLDALGGTLPRTFVVGCRPADVSEGIGLSPVVAAAVPTAIDAVERLLRTSTVGHPVDASAGRTGAEPVASGSGS